MQTEYASSSPEFWSHHAMLDAIWYEWQNKCIKCVHFGYSGSTERLVGFKPYLYRHDYINSSKLGGCGIQVTYSQIFNT